MIRWVALIGFLCAIGNAILANDWHGRLGWICAVCFMIGDDVRKIWEGQYERGYRNKNRRDRS